MYVAVKGGERAIENAHAWLAEERRGDPAIPALQLDQIDSQLGRAVDRVGEVGRTLRESLHVVDAVRPGTRQRAVHRLEDVHLRGLLALEPGRRTDARV